MAIRIFNEFGAKLADTDADIAAITTILSASVSYLLLRSRDTEIYNTVDIRSDRDWERIEKAIILICKQCLFPGKEG